MKRDAVDYPRVLMVSPSAFNNFTGGGITLSNLFRGWPSSHIAAIHSEPNPKSNEICSRYYALTPNDLGWFWPLSSFAPRRQSNSDTAADSEFTEDRKRGFVRVAAKTLVRLISADGLQDRVSPTRALMEWVDAFRPEVIYTLLGSLGHIRLVQTIAERAAVPLVIHTMDDWPSHSYRHGLLSPIFRKRTDEELMSMMERASVCMGISPAMCDAYRLRYGRTFLSFSNGLDPTKFTHGDIKQGWTLASPVRFLYAGSVYSNAQLGSLIDVCRALSELLTEGWKIEFHLRLPPFIRDQYRDLLSGFPCVRLKDSLTDATVIEEMGLSDVLVLPANFDTDSIRYFRYSNPTKLPAYLFSGTPILAYGPGEVDQIRRARKDEWGHVVEEPNRNTLKSAVRELLESETLRRRLGQQAQRIAHRDHDIRDVREEFQNALALAHKSRLE